jgi:PIN domain nuclease of toxin-antitoxin system
MNTDPAKVPVPIRNLIDDKTSERFLSVVSAWEIALKSRTGRMRITEPPDQYVPLRREAGAILSLPLDEETVLQLPKLPSIHADPFDRMLICQAIVHGMVILTPDPEIARYPVRVMW